MPRLSRSHAFRTAAVLFVLGATMAATGCASAEPDGKTLPPVIVDVDEIDGTTVEVAEGNTIDLTGDDETYLDWTAEIDDPEVVTFVPGKDDGSAQFNPGLVADQVGDTEVTLDNSSSGESVTFTVEVTAAAK